MKEQVTDISKVLQGMTEEMRFKPYLRFDKLICTIYIGYR